jgi:hypothetical protein
VAFQGGQQRGVDRLATGRWPGRHRPVTGRSGIQSVALCSRTACGAPASTTLRCKPILRRDLDI